SPSVGNLVTACFNYDNSSITLNSITDNAGNTYNLVLNKDVVGVGRTTMYSKLITATTATFIVTASFNAGTFTNMAIHEYSSISSDTANATNSNNASSTAGSTNAVSPGSASTIVAFISAPTQATTFTAPGNSFNQRAEDETFAVAPFQTSDKL